MKKNIETLTIEHGLFANVPRSLKTAVRRVLRDLERSSERFDRAAVTERQRLKRLYALLHVRPSARAQASLFATPPANTALAAVKELAQRPDAARAAALVRAHALPYLIVESALGAIDEPIALALVETMEAEELVARLPLLARRELLAGRVLDALRDRLRALARRGDVALPYRKVQAAVRNADLDRVTAGLLLDLIAAPEVEAGAIAGDTALLIDASLSMPRVASCLEIAAQVAHRVDAALAQDAALRVIVFAEKAQAIELPRGADVGRWRDALSLPASDLHNGTSVGAAVEALTKGAAVQRIVLVTDGYENRPPRLVGALTGYRERTGVAPRLYLVQPDGAGRQLATDLTSAQIPFELFAVDRHMLGLDALVPTLAELPADDAYAAICEFAATI